MTREFSTHTGYKFSSQGDAGVNLGLTAVFVQADTYFRTFIPLMFIIHYRIISQQTHKSVLSSASFFQHTANICF